MILHILAFSAPGFSNLFTSSILNALDLYMNYTAEVVLLHMYIVVCLWCMSMSILYMFDYIIYFCDPKVVLDSTSVVFII